METTAQARKRLAAQGIELEEFKQFPIKFSDGTTIYLQPEKMRLSESGFPILNHEEYLRAHHPERVQEFLKWKNHQMKIPTRL